MDIILKNGNCLNLMKNILDNSIDLIVTDPPYPKVQGGCTNHAVKLTGSKKSELSSGKYFSENKMSFDDWIPECFRVLKDNTHCLIMSDDRNLLKMIMSAENAGFKLLNILVWEKTKHSPNRYYMKNCEFILLLRKGKARNINNMGTRQVLHFSNVDKKVHPTEKPVDLLECLISNSSCESDMVLDPFMGGGSTGIACINVNRKFYGIELDEVYFNIAKQRIENIQYKGGE